MGMIDAIKKVVRFDAPVIGCVKCLTFWCCITYLAIIGMNIIQSVAVAFLLAWCAVWLDLLMGFIDNQYMRLYAKYDKDRQAAEVAESGEQAATVTEADAMPKL